MTKAISVPYCHYFYKLQINSVFGEDDTCVIFQYFKTLEGFRHPSRFQILPARDSRYLFEPVIIDLTYNEFTKDYDSHYIGLKFNTLFEKIAIQPLPEKGVEPDDHLRNIKVGFRFVFTNIGNDDDDDTIKPIPTLPGDVLKPEKTLLEQTKLSEIAC
jgi:hypothetical protein